MAKSLSKQSTLAYRHGIKGCYYLWTGQGLQSVFQSLQVDTLLGVVRCVHQHRQAVLHAGQLGGNHCKVLEKKDSIENNVSIFDYTVMHQKHIISIPFSNLNIISMLAG